MGVGCQQDLDPQEAPHLSLRFSGDSSGWTDTVVTCRAAAGPLTSVTSQPLCLLPLCPLPSPSWQPSAFAKSQISLQSPIQNPPRSYQRPTLSAEISEDFEGRRVCSLAFSLINTSPCTFSPTCPAPPHRPSSCCPSAHAGPF